MTKTVVIARYNEDLSWTKDLNKDIQVVIYNKGTDVLDTHIKLKNTGRESDTYLRYIIDNYESLSDVTVFLQGNALWHRTKHLKEAISQINDDSIDVLVNLIGYTVTSDGNGCPSHCKLPINETALRLGVQSEKYTFGPGAQYIVPRRMIISKSLSWWKKALEIHSVPDPGCPCHGNLNKMPWVFERLWPYIWNLEEIDHEN